MSDKFQPKIETIRLYDENKPLAQVTKVGILPFLPAGGQGEWRFLVMKPKTEAKHLGEPAFQLTKGTRRIHINENWCDMRDDDLLHADPSFYEPLIDTALREGHEEAGLKPGNIKKLFDMGGFVFTSASKGLKKPLHMFAAEIKDEKDFATFENSTLETRWMTLKEFAGAGRTDHVTITREILERLVKVM